MTNGGPQRTEWIGADEARIISARLAKFPDAQSSLQIETERIDTAGDPPS